MSLSLIPGRPLALLAWLLFLPLSVDAAPRILVVEGHLEEGSTLKVQGEGFGDKTPAKPLLFADFKKDLRPSALGQRLEWDGVENMEWAKEGADGSGCAKAADGSGKWTMRVDRQYWSREGEKSYIFRRQRANFLISSESQNWKIWRMWPEIANYPNIYMASNNGRVFVENVGEESGFWGRFNVPTMEWINEEIFFQASSNNVKDGVCWYRCNGADMARGSVMTRSFKAPEYMARNYVVHGVAANPSRWSPQWSPTNRIWVDEVYVDTTWARVMVTDDPKPLEGRSMEIQVPIRWSDNEIEFVARPGSFRVGQTVYIHVFNADGLASEVGFPVTIEGRPDQPASVSPRRTALLALKKEIE